MKKKYKRKKLGDSPLITQSYQLYQPLKPLLNIVDRCMLRQTCKTLNSLFIKKILTKEEKELQSFEKRSLIFKAITFGYFILAEKLLFKNERTTDELFDILCG